MTPKNSFWPPQDTPMSKVIDVKHTTSEVLDLMIEHIYAWRCIHATEKSYTVSVSYTTYPTQMERMQHISLNTGH